MIAEVKGLEKRIKILYSFVRGSHLKVQQPVIPAHSNPGSKQYIHTNKHADLYTHTYMDKYTNIHTNTQPYTHTYKHTNTHTHIQTYKDTNILWDL